MRFQTYSRSLNSLRRELSLRTCHDPIPQVNRKNRNICLRPGNRNPSVTKEGRNRLREHKRCHSTLHAGRVTDGKGAGNGLWLLRSIIEQGRGSLEITSDGVRYSLIHREDSSSRDTFSKSLSLIGGTTLVDFQLDVSQPIELDKILGPNGFIDLWMEEREEDWDGTIVRLNVAKEADGLGSRIDGSSFRNLVLNVMSSTQTVILDFSSVSVVSLSFTDEAVGKLIDTIGFSSFFERIKIEQANETCLAIIQTIISQHASEQES